MRIVGLGISLSAVAAIALWINGAGVNGAAVRAPAASAPAPVAARPMTVPPTAIGMNLGAIHYYTSQWPFANLVKVNGELSSGGGDNEPLRGPDGYFRNVPRGKALDLPIDFGDYGRPGTYDCTISPGWSVEAPHGGTISGGGDHFRFTNPAVKGMHDIRLRFTPKADGANLTHVACVPPGRGADDLDPAFLADMRPFRVIRFMDWMHANNLGPQTWAGRPKPTDLSIGTGASVEDMVRIANTLGADPWFTLPFDADADYYRSFATYVREHLAAGRKAYVELSNEVWNGSFRQSQDAGARGKARYPGVDDQKATDYYYGDRVREVMAIWTTVFAGQTKRIVRVASSQAVWPARAEDVLHHGDTWRSVDALAVAPYFGVNVQEITDKGAPRIDAVLARLPAEADKAIANALADKAIAYRYGLRFIAYEGGPDIVGFTPDASADAVAIRHDPRLYGIYLDYLRKWQSRIGDLLVLYDSTGASAYSHNDYTGQPLAEAPKMRALADFAKSLPPAP